MQHRKWPAKLENLNGFLEFASAFAEEHGFSKEQINRINLCIEEAVVNICNYAYPDTSDGEIEISLSLKNGEKLTITIADDGIPFDIEAQADPDLTSDISERNVGGLGIYFIKNLMDKIEYARNNNKNILTMVLRRK